MLCQPNFYNWSIILIAFQLMFFTCFLVIWVLTLKTHFSLINYTLIYLCYFLLINFLISSPNCLNKLMAWILPSESSQGSKKDFLITITTLLLTIKYTYCLINGQEQVKTYDLDWLNFLLEFLLLLLLSFHYFFLISRIKQNSALM